MAIAFTKYGEIEDKDAVMVDAQVDMGEAGEAGTACPADAIV
jgi:hypothetical protein